MKMHVVRNGVVVVMLSLAVGACGAGESDSSGERGLGLNFTDEATASDAGLPTYPGSKPYKDPDESSSAANIGISTPLFGVKVVAMNLQTADEPEEVASFYRQALSKYGEVLECSDTADGTRKAERADADSDELVCDSSDPGTHSVVYKVGTEKNQRIVAIKPHGNGTRFSLVHVDVRG